MLVASFILGYYTAGTPFMASVSLAEPVGAVMRTP